MEDKHTAGGCRRSKAGTLLRLFGVYARLDLLWFLRDTKYCLIQLLADTVCSLTSVAGVFLLAEQFGGFGGMTRDEMLFMLGYAAIADGVYTILTAGANTGQISRIIGRGQLDHMLIQPVPLWMQLLTSGFVPISGCSSFICGLGLSGYALYRIGQPVSLLWLMGMLASVICSVAIIAAFVYLPSCLAFAAPAAAEEIARVAYSMFDLKVYPLGGVPGFWQGVFCTVLPVGAAAWLPAKVLLDGRFSAWTAAVAASFIAAAALLFRKGMNYYAKYGSPRYSGFGHR